MKKGGILNPAICSLLAELGHLDELLIVDAGYPLPQDGHVIDLTLTPGIPRFLDVLRAVAEELVIESITLASEISEYSPKLHQEILKIVGDVDVDEVPTSSSKSSPKASRGSSVPRSSRPMRTSESCAARRSRSLSEYSKRNAASACRETACGV